ncbi:hypothetical protein L1049_009132 [Liquidambar formosana]
MRIRKRQVPFPLSSLLPTPLSDLRLNRSPVVQQQHNHHEEILTHPKANLSLGEDGKATHVHLQPSDQPNQTLPPIGTCEAQKEKEEEEKKKHCLELMVQREEGEEEDKRGRKEEEEKKSNDTRKGSVLGAETGTEVLPLSSSSHQVGRWFEGEKAFPLKKRRGSFNRRANEETIVEKEKKMKTKMKTKMNKKYAQQKDSEEAEKETKEGLGHNNNSAKKRARGGALMEGSRCSRVNGRGWRCCQQTLVGYSLCEHHLGKGRLRSMTSVRSRAMAAPKKDDTKLLSSSSSSLIVEKQPDHMLSNDDDNDEDEKKPLMIAKKRMKIGMVKARSLSSLLGQTNNAVAVADNSKGNNV